MLKLSVELASVTQLLSVYVVLWFDAVVCSSLAWTFSAMQVAGIWSCYQVCDLSVLNSILADSSIHIF